jgi:hypothetical protein
MPQRYDRDQTVCAEELLETHLVVTTRRGILDSVRRVTVIALLAALVVPAASARPFLGVLGLG